MVAMGVFVINIAPPRASENETIILAGLVFLMNAETGECSFFSQVCEIIVKRDREIFLILKTIEASKDLRS